MRLKIWAVVPEYGRPKPTLHYRSIVVSFQGEDYIDLILESDRPWPLSLFGIGTLSETPITAGQK